MPGGRGTAAATRYLRCVNRIAGRADTPGKNEPAAEATAGLTRRTAFAAAASVLAGGALAGCSAGRQPAAGQAGGTGGPTSTRQLTIRSDSMNPTLVNGQVITIEALVPGSYTARRQDVVAVHPTVEYQGLHQTDLMMRRIIGLPGDTVSCAGAGSPLMLNGAALHEPYLHPGDEPSTIAFDVKLPPGYLWLLGDHRAIALDCRFHLSDPHAGGIPLVNVVGLYLPKA